MNIKVVIFLLHATLSVKAQPNKCDQIPLGTKVMTPSENGGMFELSVVTKEQDKKDQYMPAQTYVLILKTNEKTRPFKNFMITVEDPNIDNDMEGNPKQEDVGTLKTLDPLLARYSDRCHNSVESIDYSEKQHVEIHWVSPKNFPGDKKVRLRAMVAENDETWYVGDNLTVVLTQDSSKPIDNPPYDVIKYCNLCSEARYEVIFTGHWSRMTHPRHYPLKPDDNGYSHMIGASHDLHYVLWEQGNKASKGLQELVENDDIDFIMRDIINNISVEGGTRTLIIGQKRHHPHMSVPSYALFRTDKIHHLFSIAVAMKPSPDWFLGTSKFELCSPEGWLENAEIPLYPWDAGTMDGISYESPRTVSQPVSNVERVAVGSFDSESPFYKVNLNDLKPFASLKVQKLDEFIIEDGSCEVSDQNNENEDIQLRNTEVQDESIAEEEPEVEPVLSESRQKLDQGDCSLSEWTEWSQCEPNENTCGAGTQFRTRYIEDKNLYYASFDGQKTRYLPDHSSCQAEQDASLVEYQKCSIKCS